MNTPVVKLPYRPDTRVLRPTENKTTLRAEHKTALDAIGGEAAAIASAAQKIADIVSEAQANGGQVQIQPQVQFLTGALVRLVKDWGAIEHLQKHGAQARRSPR